MHEIGSNWLNVTMCTRGGSPSANATTNGTTSSGSPVGNHLSEEAITNLSTELAQKNSDQLIESVCDNQSVTSIDSFRTAFITYLDAFQNAFRTQIQHKFEHLQGDVNEFMNDFKFCIQGQLKK